MVQRRARTHAHTHTRTHFHTHTHTHHTHTHTHTHTHNSLTHTHTHTHVRTTHLVTQQFVLDGWRQRETKLRHITLKRDTRYGAVRGHSQQRVAAAPVWSRAGNYGGYTGCDRDGRCGIRV